MVLDFVYPCISRRVRLRSKRMDERRNVGFDVGGPSGDLSCAEQIDRGEHDAEVYNGNDEVDTESIPPVRLDEKF